MKSNKLTSSQINLMARAFASSPMGEGIRLIVREEMERALKEGVDIKPIVINVSDFNKLLNKRKKP